MECEKRKNWQVGREERNRGRSFESSSRIDQLNRHGFSQTSATRTQPTQKTKMLVPKTLFLLSSFLLFLVQSVVLAATNPVQLLHHTIHTDDTTHNLLADIQSLSLLSNREQPLKQTSKLYNLLNKNQQLQQEVSNNDQRQQLQRSLDHRLQLLIQLKHHSLISEVEDLLNQKLTMKVPPDAFVIHENVYDLSEKLSRSPSLSNHIHWIGHVQPQYKTRLNFTNLSIFESQRRQSTQSQEKKRLQNQNQNQNHNELLDTIELYALLIEPLESDQTRSLSSSSSIAAVDDISIDLKSFVKQSFRDRGQHELLSMYSQRSSDEQSNNAHDTELLDSSIRVQLASPTKMIVQTSALFARDVLQYLTQQERVHWIERKLPMGLFNSAANEILQSDGSIESDIYSSGTRKRVENDEHERRVQSTNSFWDEKRPIWARGVTGSGEVVGVGDTGIDYDHCFFHDTNETVAFNGHNRLHRKIVGYQTVEIIDESGQRMYSDKQDVVNGHGTHVAGSIAGYVYDGAPNNDTLHRFGGVAKDAKLFFTDIHNPKFNALLIPDDLYEDYFPVPYHKGGARIHSNSWGCTFSVFNCRYDCICYWAVTTKYGKAGTLVSNDWCTENLGSDCCRVCNVYDSRAAEVDRFVTENDDMLIVFAVGNVGYTSSSGTVGSPATSKNSLTVGASHTTSDSFVEAVDYDDMSDIFEALKNSGITNTEQCCSARGKTDEETERIKSLCCPTFIKKWYKDRKKYLNSNNIAYFSSRGPTSDGRIKPDVVGPGYYVISSHSDGDVNSHQCGLGRPATNNDAALITMKGTSMAAPLVSGSAALVRDYYKQNGVSPSGALVKATLAHSGHNLPGYVDLNGVGLLAPVPKVPNSFSGFGLVSLGKVLSFADSMFKLFSYDRVQLSGYNRQVYCYQVVDDHEFKATLSWYDPPASPVASVLLVNDLDLDVFYYRNGSKSSTRVPGNGKESGDRVNTIEQSTVSRIPRDYLVAVTVRAERLGSSKGQKYSLVVTGAVEPLDSCWVPPAGLSSRTIFFIIVGVCSLAALLLVVGVVIALAIIKYRDHKREQERLFGRTLGTGHVTLQDEDEAQT